MDYLVHYGVKGMKWGVRHDQPSSKPKYHATPKNHKEWAENAQQDAETRKKIKSALGLKTGTVGDKIYDKRAKVAKRLTENEKKEIGAKEDAAEYKYNKSGEHGAKGLARAVKSTIDNAKVSKKALKTAGKLVSRYGGSIF